MSKTNKKEISGLIPVLTTPINSEGQFDADAQKRIVEYLVSKKIGGLWVLGTGSEDMNLTFSQRVEIAQTVVETVNNRVPILLGASFFASKDILDFIKETQHLNIEGYHAMVYHHLLGPDSVDWFYRDIAYNSHKPIWLYSSANYGRMLTPDIVDKLKKYPNIAGIKYSTKNIHDIANVARMADKTNFQIISAVAGIMYSCLSLGVKAHTTSLGSCLPDPLIEIIELFKAGKQKEALNKQMEFNSFLGCFPKRLRIENFFQAAEEKFILQLRGLCNEYTTSYYQGLTDQEKSIIQEALEQYSYLD